MAVVDERISYYRGLIDDGWSTGEAEQIRLMKSARDWERAAEFTMLGASAMTPIPDVETGGGGIAFPFALLKIGGGGKLAHSMRLIGEALRYKAQRASGKANISGITASFARRGREWKQQRTLAEREKKQLDKQHLAAQVRLAMATADLAAHERQITNSNAVRQFMERKYTNHQLYHWMVGQISTLYFQSYQLAHDLAKSAQRAYQRELGDADASFVTFGYWDGLKKGLLAGERLQYDLERMDTAYLRANRREYEITKHVSLALLDPVALTKLRTTGACAFTLPEALYDLDHAGHLFRRIHSVAVTIPSVTGPQTGVPARLTQGASRIRVDATTYAYDSDDGMRVLTGAAESIAISNGQGDSGLFAGADPRDERYLPFEGTGAISDWTLTLTSATPTFDATTISDVVLTMRYTARQGGEIVRNDAITALSTALGGGTWARALSARHEFPTEWNAFQNPPQGATEATLTLPLTEDHFPYFARDLALKTGDMELIALVDDPVVTPSLGVQWSMGTDPAQSRTLAASAAYGGHPATTIEPGAAVPRPLTLTVDLTDAVSLDDLVVIATYQVTL